MAQTAASLLAGYLGATGQTPAEFGASCTPAVSHESIRAVLRGSPVGGKVALAIYHRLSGVTLEMLLDPEGTARGGERARA